MRNRLKERQETEAEWQRRINLKNLIKIEQTNYHSRRRNRRTYFSRPCDCKCVEKKRTGYGNFFVGAKGKMEMEKVPEAGYQIRGIDIAGFNRSSLIKNIGLPYKLIKSFFQVRKIFQ